MFTEYSDDNWTLMKLARYRSSLTYNKDPRFTYNVPDVRDSFFVDGSFGRKFRGLGADGEFYISIQNLFDRQAPIFYPNLGAPGFIYPSFPGDDIIGRRFNAGFRVRF